MPFTVDVVPFALNDVLEPFRLADRFLSDWDDNSYGGSGQLRQARPNRSDFSSWIQNELQQQHGGQLVAKDNGLEMNLNVSGYKPEELAIDVNDGYMTVSGKHEEKSDDGRKFVSRSFSRTHSLPKNVNMDGIKSSLIDGKLLRVEAPLKAIEQPKERVVPINVTRGNKDAVKKA